MPPALVREQRDLGRRSRATFEWAQLLAFRRRLVPQTDLVEHELDACGQTHHVVMRESEGLGGRILRAPEMEHLALLLGFELLARPGPTKLDEAASLVRISTIFFLISLICWC